MTEIVEPIDAEKEKVTYERCKRKPNNGRNIDTSKLPRERQLHDLNDAEKLCECGHQLQKIGEDITEQLEYVPSTLKVIEHVRPKYIAVLVKPLKRQQNQNNRLQKASRLRVYLQKLL